MKHFLKSIFLFIPFAAAAYLLLLLVWGSAYVPNVLKPNLNYRIGSYGHMYSRLQEAKQTADVDILFLGSSHAYRGFDTRHFEKQGFKVFNLGSSSQTPVQAELLLKRYSEKLNPKVLVYEVYPEAFSSDGVESSLDIIANDKTDAYSVKMALNTKNAKVYNTLMYASLSELLGLNTDFVEARQKGEDTYVDGGYVEKTVTHFKHANYEQSEWIFEERQMRCFENIISAMKAKGVRVVLVYAPIARGSYQSYSNGAVFDSMMRKISTYYNFNTLLNLDDSLHFYDSHHLNQHGVDLFNAALIEILD